MCTGGARLGVAAFREGDGPDDGEGCAVMPNPSICSDQSKHFSAVGLANASLALSRACSALAFAPAHPIAEDPPSRWSAHEATTSAPAAAGQRHQHLIRNGLETLEVRPCAGVDGLSSPRFDGALGVTER
jgi:hypothetical protein